MIAPALRTILAGLFTLALVVSMATGALAQERFSRIVVDVSPMRTTGTGFLGGARYGLFADRTQQIMMQEASRIFADRIDPRDRSAPVLVLRIDSVQFGSGWSGDFDSQAVYKVTDYMEGVGIVMAGGKVIRQVPMLGAYDNVLGPTLLMVDNAGPRLHALSAFWAGWLKRRL